MILENKGETRNVTVVDEGRCYGCGACVLACGLGAVQLVTDADGYYKRNIDESMCVHCGKCLAVCPSMQSADEIETSAHAYVAYCNERQDVLESTSGGIAHVIARECLRRGYTVIGAAWSKDHTKVEHILVQDEEELLRLKKSKYVQSTTVEAFSQIKKLDKVVVFGTPCQIAGLRNLYGQKPGMILVDFDCMGPAGLGLWGKYLAYLRRADPASVRSISMRNKQKSWMVYGTKVVFEDGREYFMDKYHDPFCVLYHLAHAIQGACLSECRYLNRSKADLRMGDAWDYTDGYSRQQIHDGLSVVTPLTAKGQAVLNTIVGQVQMRSVRRIPARPSASGADSGVWDCLRDPTATIEQAVDTYHTAGLGKRVARKVSYWLSSNDGLYLFVKKVLKAIR